MVAKKKNYRFILKCDACEFLSRALNQNCNACGLVDGHYVTDDPGNSHALVCSICEKPISPRILPSICSSCGKRNLKWWDNSTNNWFSPDLSQLYKNNPDTLWLKGEFDGDLVGDYLDETKHEGALKNNRIFSVEIKGGTLKNIEQVKKPPFEVSANEKVNPIRQRRVKNVLIAVDDKYASVELVDFRLHNWSEFKDDQLEQDKIYSRIHGQAYGCLNPGSEFIEEVVTPPSQPEVKPKPEITPQAQETSEADHTEKRRNWAGARNIVSAISPTTGCKFCNLASKLWTSLVALIFCGFSKALLVFSGITIACIFDQYFTSKNWKIISVRKEKIISALLVFIAIASLYYLYEFSARFECNHYVWPVLILYACFVIASSLLYECLPKTFLGILWVVGMLMLCDQNCFLRHHRTDSLAQVIPNNNISGQVSSASQNTESGKIVTLDEAMQNPELLKDCRNKLYLPNATLFATDSYRINADSQGNLNQLIVLFSKLDKESHITITGHSDATGDRTAQGFIHNIQLSEQRASAVANWLSAHGSLNADRIDVQGVGSKFPLVEDPASAYNRRVEIHLTCDKGS